SISLRGRYPIIPFLTPRPRPTFPLNTCIYGDKLWRAYSGNTMLLQHGFPHSNYEKDRRWLCFSLILKSATHAPRIGESFWQGCAGFETRFLPAEKGPRGCYRHSGTCVCIYMHAYSLRPTEKKRKRKENITYR